MARHQCRQTPRTRAGGGNLRPLLGHVDKNTRGLGNVFLRHFTRGDGVARLQQLSAELGLAAGQNREGKQTTVLVVALKDARRGKFSATSLSVRSPVCSVCKMVSSMSCARSGFAEQFWGESDRRRPEGAHPPIGWINDNTFVACSA